MGGGFMADNKDKTMQEQATTFSKQHRKRLQQHHHHQQQQQDFFRHSHHASPSSNPKPKIPPPPPLKVILKVPHSSPSPNSTPSSPLSRPSSRSPPSSEPPHRRHHLHHHHHHYHRPSSPAPPSLSPSPASSPTPPPPRTNPLQRQKLTSELQQYHHIQQQQQRPSKPPLQPPLQQIRQPPLDSKQNLHKKLHESSGQLQHRSHHASASSRQDRANPNGQQASPDPENQQDESTGLSSRLGRLANPSEDRCTDQADLAVSRRYKRIEQEEEARQADSRRVRQIEQADLLNPISPWQVDEADLANPSCLRQGEQGQEFSHSRIRREESTVDPPTEELELSYKQAEEVDYHHSRSKRLERQQLDEGAFLKRPQRRHQQEQQQEEHHSHTATFPKRLRSAHHHQGQQQEQGRAQLASPKVTPHSKPTQISSHQQHPLKKLTQSRSVQGPHGLHQSSKFPSQTTPSPHLVPPPSTPASMQSSAPSLSTSAASDEAHKPSKKRKLQSLLELESTDGQSVAADGVDCPPQVNPAMPATTSAAGVPVVPPFMEVDDSRECTTANSSPKGIGHDPQLIPARRLLNNILDRLQKKDKFGVFAEPVDPKEVPSYYDIIKDPMDFGTMRSRINSGHYTSIELFQKDVFLICDNAMQFNGKGTVYFRHARSIKDIAERILEELKVSGLSVEMDEPLTKSKNGGTGRSSEKHESCMNTGSPSDARLDNLDEFSGYFLRASGSIDGRRSQAIDENRRSSYLSTSTSLQGNDSLLTTISGDSSHLVPTGYQMEYLYSKSLARFAADLGPLVWKIAAEKIRKALPTGCPFGLGWVGEKESGGAALAPSAKQQMFMQSSTHQTAKLPYENGSVATSDMGLSSATQSKLDSTMQSNVGYLQDNQENLTKADSKSGVQASMKLRNETRSPMVFGNSLVQNERPERLDQRILGQPSTRFHSSDGSRSLGPAQPQAEMDGLVKSDHTSGIFGNKAKFVGQVNLNHPVSAQPDEGAIVENGFAIQDGVRTDFHEGKTLPGPGPSIGAIPMSKMGGLPFNLVGTFNPTPPQSDGVNLSKAVTGEVGMNATARNQLDGKGTGQLSRLNLLNDSLSTEAGSIATSNGKNDAIYQPSKFQMSHGSFMPPNLNMPAQPRCGISDMDTRDGNALDPVRFASSLSHTAQGFSLLRNANGLDQQAAVSSQNSNPSNDMGTRDVSTVDQGLSIQPVAPCPERVVGERLKETGDLMREREMLSLTGRITTGGSSAMPRKVPTSERGFTMQHLEPRNGQRSSHDFASATIQNFDQLNRKQSASGGFSMANFSPGIHPSNSASMVREVPGWKPAQQPDSTPVTGIGSIIMQNQVLKSPGEQPEVNPGGVHFTRLQTSGVQDPQIFGYGNNKHVSSMPHFLQHQLGGDNGHGLPNQHQQAKLHVQSNSLLPGVQNLSSSDSREANFVRQFQLPTHRGFAQAGSPAWQYSAQAMAAQGTHQSFAVAPDLNVSLPLTKSPYEQPNGSELQQPDLALQL